MNGTPAVRKAGEKGGSARASSSSRRLVPGTDFGAYRVKDLIGSGGFGEVFLAVHRVLRRPAAVKVVRPELTEDSRVVDLFLREARIIAQFDHPNLVEVYDAGESDDGVLFMAMRLVSGGSLSELVERKGSLPRLQALSIMRDCCEGLAAIHDMGLAHRDIKPANILLDTDGRACITDMGLACFHQERVPGLEVGRARVGTLRFMAPEMLTGVETANPRTDLYALGITFQVILTGRLPLAEVAPTEAVRRTVSGDLPDPLALRPDLGVPLGSLLRDLTALDPAERPESVQQVRARVEVLLAEAQGRKPYAPPHERAPAKAVAAAVAGLRKGPLLDAILDALPGPGLVLNGSRQVLAANGKADAILGSQELAETIGRRPGEALGCGNARRGTDGCGTSPACAYCGLGRAISEVEQGAPTPVEGELHLSGEAGRKAFDFAFRLTELPLGAGRTLLLSLLDVSAEKRRRVIEKSLVSNLLDTADSMRRLAGPRTPGNGAASEPGGSEEAGAFQEAGRALMDEAVFQQHLLAAEAGELQPLWEEVEIKPTIADACGALRHHPAGRGRRIVIRCQKDLRARTDGLLLQRSLRNLIRNALEACAPGQEVAVEAKPWPAGGVEIRISNPQVMAEDVREQVFSRSFSTKAASGRGIGTHAARLFVEGYLRGEIGFASTAPEGTTFWIRVPAQPPAEAAAVAKV